MANGPTPRILVLPAKLSILPAITPAIFKGGNTQRSRVVNLEATTRMKKETSIELLNIKTSWTEMPNKASHPTADST